MAIGLTCLLAPSASWACLASLGARGKERESTRVRERERERETRERGGGLESKKRKQRRGEKKLRFGGKEKIRKQCILKIY